MFTRKSILTSALMAMLFISVDAYAKYYQIIDTTTGRVYFSKHVSYTDCGTVRFKEARTDARITLPSTRVTEITDKEYKHGGVVYYNCTPVNPPRVIIQP